MRPVWKGSISFGLVSIPIKLITAIESKSTGFRLLDRKDKTPIRYIRWNPKKERAVPWEDIVKGLEVSKNKYYVIDKEQLERIKPEKTDHIDIKEFVDAQQLDPIYFNSHYYVLPERKKEKTYFLFKEVLQQTAKVAIGRFVMREREYVCAIESYKKGMLLTTLNYGYEIREINKQEELKNPPKLEKKGMELAKQLMDKLYEEKFDVNKFKDTFEQELEKMLKKKGKKVTVKETKIKRENLVEALKASLK